MKPHILCYIQVSLISSGKSGDERDVSITTRNTDLESAPEIRSPPYESQTYKPEPSKPTVPPRSTLHIKKLEASTGAAEGPLSPADCIDLNEEEVKIDRVRMAGKHDF